jgi:2-amino-4-hydroxy-6-hydroxymethyldihydropteridine diphosphokinase
MSVGPILVAIGANLPGPAGAPPLATCEAAVARLALLPGLRLAARSAWWDSAAWPDPAGPRYVNGVVRLEGEADPAALLAALQAIEHASGRVRGEANAPRTLDLDLLAMGDLVRDAPDPVLPHPRMTGRAFVLWPAAEVAALWLHPGLGASLASLAASLPPAQDCQRLPD